MTAAGEGGAREEEEEVVHPGEVATIKLAKARSLVGVPMLKENEVIGGIAIYRQEVRPFSDKQIELLKNFASQAVIAIENTRLLKELRERTDDLTGRTADLTEALEQQTATSDVLKVISSSPGDLEPVFATMLEKAVSICDAKYGNIYRWDGEFLHLLAAHDTPPALLNFAPSIRCLMFISLINILKLRAGGQSSFGCFREHERSRRRRRGRRIPVSTIGGSMGTTALSLLFWRQVERGPTLVPSPEVERGRDVLTLTLFQRERLICAGAQARTGMAWRARNGTMASAMPTGSLASSAWFEPASTNGSVCGNHSRNRS